MYMNIQCKWEGGFIMTVDDRNMLNRIMAFADKVDNGGDPERIRVSEQIEKIRPVLQQIAMEKGMPVEDVFIKYMDLATENIVEYEQKMKDSFGDIFSGKPE